MGLTSKGIDDALIKKAPITVHPITKAKEKLSADGIPHPYRLTETHVEFAADGKPDDEPIWTPICERLEVVNQTRNERGEEWGRLVRFKDRDGRSKEVAIPMHLFAGNGNEVRALLLGRGLSIEPNRKAREHLEAYIQKCGPGQSIRCVARTGWYQDGEERSFVFPDEVIGSSSVVLQSDEYLDHAYVVAGSSREWRERIGRFAVGNHRLTFAISAAFAAPLLDLADMEGGGFHFNGASSLGKTTILRVAGSVWGGGASGFIRSWRATSNGLESVAALHNDALLCIDELGQVDSREAGPASYMLANGAGKSRAARSGGGRKVARWSLMFLSTGEQSLAEKVAEDSGRRARAGQEIRLLDIPADAGVGLGCFDSIHGYDNPALLADHLAEATRQIYGAPAREYIRALLAVDRIQFKGEIKEAIKAFKDRLCVAGSNGQIERAAARFGLVGLAGELAIKFGIAPWPVDSAIASAEACFHAWYKARGGSRTGESLALHRQVKSFFEKHGEARFSPLRQDLRDPACELTPFNPLSDPGRPTFNRVGFRYDETEASQFRGTHFLVLPESMAEVCQGFSLAIAAKELLSAGMLLAGEDGRVKRQHRIPGSAKPTRVYHFLPSVMESEDANDC